MKQLKDKILTNKEKAKLDHKEFWENEKREALIEIENQNNRIALAEKQLSPNQPN